MPFTMIHLAVAGEIAKRQKNIIDINSFLKGAIAPDAIHVRFDYHSDMKKTSHLVVGEESWGRVTNNEQWVTSVVEYYKGHVTPENRAFLLGYCVHILTDIQNNRKVWQPFYEKNKGLFEMGKGSVYHSESALIDQVLYQKIPMAAKMLSQMIEGKSITLEGLVTSQEVDLFVDTMIKGHYSNSKISNYESNHYVKLEEMLKFIEKESYDIEGTLFDVPSIS